MMTSTRINNTRFYCVFNFITRNTKFVLILVYSTFSFQALSSTSSSSIFLVFFPCLEKLIKIFLNIYKWKTFWYVWFTGNMFDRIILRLMLTETWKLQTFRKIWIKIWKIRTWKCCRSIYGTEVLRTSSLLSPLFKTQSIWLLIMWADHLFVTCVPTLPTSTLDRLVWLFWSSKHRTLQNTLTKFSLTFTTLTTFLIIFLTVKRFTIGRAKSRFLFKLTTLKLLKLLKLLLLLLKLHLLLVLLSKEGSLILLIIFSQPFLFFLFQLTQLTLG